MVACSTGRAADERRGGAEGDELQDEEGRHQAGGDPGGRPADDLAEGRADDPHATPPMPRPPPLALPSPVSSRKSDSRSLPGSRREA